MYFRAKPEEDRHCDNSIMVLPSSETDSQKATRDYHQYTAKFLLFSGLLGFFISYPFTFLPHFLGILIHFFIVIFVSASLNFLIVFGISDFMNFFIFSLCGFKSVDEFGQGKDTGNPMIESNSQVRLIRLWQ